MEEKNAKPRLMEARGHTIDLTVIVPMQIVRFKRQRAAESKLLEIKERKERRGRSTKASALSTPVEPGEEDVLDDDGEEEREVCFHSVITIE